MDGMEMDVDAVRAASQQARRALGELAPLDAAEESVRVGSQLFRHEEASPAMVTSAERIQELLDELRLLTGDVVDALDSAVTSYAKTDKVGSERFAGRQG